MMLCLMFYDCLFEVGCFKQAKCADERKNVIQVEITLSKFVKQSIYVGLL